MIKIPEVVRELVLHNDFLAFGVSKKLFNLSALSEFLHANVENRTKKSVQNPAILMALSRLQKSFSKISLTKKSFEIEKISATSHLCTLTFFRTDSTLQQIFSLQKKLFIQNIFFAFSQSSNEITIILPAEFLAIARSEISDFPKSENPEIAALSIQFSAQTAAQSGLLFFLLQTIYFQNINLVEITSTFTEFVFYLPQKDLKRAFSALHDRFF